MGQTCPKRIMLIGKKGMSEFGHVNVTGLDSNTKDTAIVVSYLPTVFAGTRFLCHGNHLYRHDLHDPAYQLCKSEREGGEEGEERKRNREREKERERERERGGGGGEWGITP